MACVELRGSAAGTNHVAAAQRGEGDGCAPLAALLEDNGRAGPCASCGPDRRAWFSFCLNRAVNEDRTKHCMSCGRCFYFRPGECSPGSQLRDLFVRQRILLYYAESGGRL